MDKIDVVTKKVDVLPMVKYYMDQLGIYGLFSKYVENPKRSPVDSAQILSIMVANIVCASRPLYRVEQWAADYMDGLSEHGFNASIYNDDQLAKKLDLLFKADRNSFMAELSSNAIDVYQLENKQIHNDSTSVTFFGQYENEDPKAVKLKYGFNKDLRPDCKQIVFGLNITADGNVPLSFELFDGNRTDDTTHIPNWSALREFLGESDFIYIADCKLCSQKNLDHIHEHGGMFITIVPKNRSEVKQFYEFLKTNPIEWQYAYETPNSRKKSETVLYKTYEGEPSKNGYRIIWVHSSAKEKQDKGRRENRIAKTDSQLTELCPRLNQYNLKTKKQIEEAIKKPTWNNLTRFFENVHLGMIEKNGQIIHTILKGVTELHETVLRLLGVSVSAYTTIQDQWWTFKNSVLIQSVDST